MLKGFEDAVAAVWSDDVVAVHIAPETIEVWALSCRLVTSESAKTRNWKTTPWDKQDCMTIVTLVTVTDSAFAFDAVPTACR